MIDHVFKSHQTTQDTGKKSNFTIKKQTTIKSPFIHQGEFLKEIENDPYYDYENFEYVMDLKTGKKKLIGAGAFGEVFLTKNKLDNKLFAVKHVSKLKVKETGSQLEYIYREINIHRRLIHNNIIRLYNYVETTDSFFLVNIFNDNLNKII